MACIESGVGENGRWRGKGNGGEGVRALVGEG